MTAVIIPPWPPEDASRNAGVDMVPVDDLGEAAGFRVTALCSKGLHEVVPGADCPHCGASPDCDDCPGREP